MVDLFSDSLPLNIRSRRLGNGNGLSMHVLEAGDAGRPLVLLLHGFPELAFSWRRILPALADAGFWAVAPDQRGYGRTTGWDARFDGDPHSYWILNLVEDIVGLVGALGASSVATIVGHDFGSPVAAWCALTRPDLFRSVALMSAPFAGPPRFVAGLRTSPMQTIQRDLERLSPPRKHYQLYYSCAEAAADLQNAPQGVHEFLRAYYHVKSADWAGNHPEPLKDWSAQQLARMPTYYIMNLHESMAQTVSRDAPTRSQVDACQWLTESELRVYSDTFARTGFQGGLLWYRGANEIECIRILSEYSGRQIAVPTCFIAGRRDWGIYQAPLALETMASKACADFRGVQLIDDAGHWVQQEQWQALNALLLRFIRDMENL